MKSKQLLKQDEIYRNFICWVDKEFCFLKWLDSKTAQELIRKAKDILTLDPEAPLSKTKGVAERIAGLLIRENTYSDNESSSQYRNYRIDLPSM